MLASSWPGTHCRFSGRGFRSDKECEGGRSLFQWIMGCWEGGEFEGLDASYNFIMWSNLLSRIERGELLFKSVRQPKYHQGRIRVFKGSVVLKVSLIAGLGWACSELYQRYYPSEIIIPYPEPKPIE